jgi:hypothetical protein
MNKFYLAIAVVWFGLSNWAFAQTGPFDPEKWPDTLSATKTVHYVVTDGGFTAPGDAWTEGLSILSGGDQITEDITIGGHTGKKVTGSVLNIADSMFADWADDETIDILIQAYGDAALFDSQGQPRDFKFLTGVLPDLQFPVGGQVPVEAKNKKWNWILFRIANGVRDSDGTRLVGSIPANAQGSYDNGGVNGGTIRFEGAANLIVRVVAFGAQGAFGEPDAINKFAAADTCDPEPETNLAGIDLAANATNHMVVINDGDQTVVVENSVGPAGDKRRAVRPEGSYLNFGVTDNYLGVPCNDPRAMKVCVDYYDDPAFAGAEVRFGPEAYATDNLGGIGTYAAANRQLLQGSGQWVRRSWTIPAVNLQGVNAGAYTAGPRFVSENGQVFVSRFELAVLRTGTNVLAGQDPLEDCYEDPDICTDKYGNYAELDLAKDIKDGLDVGSSTGDQEMIVAEAGPANDRRLAVHPAQDEGTAGAANPFLNFAITEEALGPSTQPPAQLAICIEYYDDPALVGTAIRPEVYMTEVNGAQAFGYTPSSYYVTLQGSNIWRTAYWEIEKIKFIGVNQTPQAAARFVTANNGDVRAKIAVSRVRYAVIRPCGSMAGVNLLASCKPSADVELTVERSGNNILVSWEAAAAGYAIEGASTLTNPRWAAINATVLVVDGRNVVTLPIGNATQFFRLAK